MLFSTCSIIVHPTGPLPVLLGRTFVKLYILLKFGGSQYLVCGQISDFFRAGQEYDIGFEKMSSF